MCEEAKKELLNLEQWLNLSAEEKNKYTPCLCSTVVYCSAGNHFIDLSEVVKQVIKGNTRLLGTTTAPVLSVMVPHHKIGCRGKINKNRNNQQWPEDEDSDEDGGDSINSICKDFLKPFSPKEGK